MGTSGARRSRYVHYIWPPLLLLLVGGSVVIWWPRSQGRVSGAPERPAPTPAIARRETRPPLDPALFVGKAALAHQAARDMPGTLDQLYCYCECDKHMGHKSLLSCYTDGHAAT